MRNGEIHSCPELMDFIQEVGFLPLLDSGIRGYSAEESFERMFEHLRRLLPNATEKQITKLIK